MIELNVPKDVTKYKPKLVAGLTFRQAASLVVASIIAVPIYLYLKDIFIVEVVALGCGVLAIPILLVGFLPVYEMPFEKFAFLAIKTLFFTPAKRRYASENNVDTVMKEYGFFEEDAVDRIKRTSSITTKKKKEKRKPGVMKNQVSADPDLFSIR